MIKLHPTYVSRAVQKAYGTEHPIGDPFGGAAYGELNGGGSVGKVLGSVLPMVAGAVMMLTPAAPMGAMLLGGAMFAGGALNGIGQLTGNQDLQKIGGITSAVAGVASMGYGLYTNWDSITGAVGGFLEEGAAVSTEAGAVGGAIDAGAGGGAALNTVNAPSVASTLASESSTLAPTVSGAFDTNAFAGELANQINTASSTPLNMSTGNMLASAQGTVDAGGAAANAINNTNALTSIPGVGAPSVLGEGMSVPGTLAQSLPGATIGAADAFGTASAFTGTPAALPGSAASFGSTGAATVDTSGSLASSLMSGGEQSTGLLSSVGNFLNKYPGPAMMGLQAVSGMAEGASPKSQAEGEYLQAMTALKQAEANYINSGRSQEALAEFNRAKNYEEEKRAAYNASITAMSAPNMSAAVAGYNPAAMGAKPAATAQQTAQAGLINQARA